MQIFHPLAQDLEGAFKLALRAAPKPLVITVLLVIPLTAVMAISGADAAVNQLAQNLMPMWASILWSAPPLFLGMVVPFLIPLTASIVPGGQSLAPALWATFGLSLLLVSVLKATTGRTHPEATVPSDLYERSVSFSLLSGEVFEGWPSGHSATNGAVAIALLLLTRSSIIRGAAIVWVLWVWTAVVLGISGQVHWLSDMIAGAALALVVPLSLPLTKIVR